MGSAAPHRSLPSLSPSPSRDSRLFPSIMIAPLLLFAEQPLTATREAEAGGCASFCYAPSGGASSQLLRQSARQGKKQKKKKKGQQLPPATAQGREIRCVGGRASGRRAERRGLGEWFSFSPYWSASLPEPCTPHGEEQREGRCCDTSSYLFMTRGSGDGPGETPLSACGA